MKFLAIIVTYNPDVERLEENIKAIATQVDKVVIVDNGSDDQEFRSYIIRRFSEMIKIRVLHTHLIRE